MKDTKFNSNEHKEKVDFLPNKHFKNGNEPKTNETKEDTDKSNKDKEKFNQKNNTKDLESNNKKKKEQKKEYNNIGNKNNPDSRNNSNENSEDGSDSFCLSEDIESLEQSQIRRSNERRKDIIITKIDSGKILPLDEAKDLINKKDYQSLLKIKFPYLRQCEFNSEIFQTDLKTFRKLIFSCPICSNGYRNYSIPYHIFQNHFEQINKFLTEKEIAKCCSKLLQLEKEKIEISLNNFSNLALLYDNCKFRGNSLWRQMTNDSILKIKRLNVEKIYFKKSQKEVMDNLSRNLPINKNKNDKRKYKEIKK